MKTSAITTIIILALTALFTSCSTPEQPAEIPGPETYTPPVKGLIYMEDFGEFIDSNITTSSMNNFTQGTGLTSLENLGKQYLDYGVGSTVVPKYKGAKDNILRMIQTGNTVIGSSQLNNPGLFVNYIVIKKADFQEDYFVEFDILDDYNSNQTITFVMGCSPQIYTTQYSMYRDENKLNVGALPVYKHVKLRLFGNHQVEPSDGTYTLIISVDSPDNLTVGYAEMDNISIRKY